MGDSLSRSASCTPEQIAQNLSGCTELCNERIQPDDIQVSTQTCGNNECDVDRKEKTVTIDYEKTVFGPLPVPPFTPRSCNTTVRVMVQPPIVRCVKVPEQTELVQVCETPPYQTQNIPEVVDQITYQLPNYVFEGCKEKEPQYECVADEIQVCKPVLVWRKEAFCQSGQGQSGKFGDSAMTITIRQVQTNLIQLGYDASPVNGRLHSKTTDALRKFQRDKGLAVGGKLTIETLTELGISVSR